MKYRVTVLCEQVQLGALKQQVGEYKFDGDGPDAVGEHANQARAVFELDSRSVQEFRTGLRDFLKARWPDANPVVSLNVVQKPIRGMPMPPRPDIQTAGDAIDPADLVGRRFEQA